MSTATNLSSAAAINGSGTANFGSGQVLPIATASGDITLMHFTNTSNTTCTIIASGAPNEIWCTDGTRFNGLHTIAAYDPNANVTALGDFQGRLVHVFNISQPDATCHADVREA